MKNWVKLVKLSEQKDINANVFDRGDQDEY
jgi:hypothetical protein